MDDIPRSIILILCLIPFAGFFAGSETAFSFCNEARIRAMAENGSRRAKRLSRVLDDFDRTIVTLLIIINIIYISVSSIARVTVGALIKNDAGSVIATVASTLLVFMFSETIPKNIARVNADRWALFAAYPISFFRVLLAPLSAFFTYIGESVKKILPAKEALPDVTEDEFEEMVENVEDEGLLEPVEKDIIKSTIHFGDILAGQIMTPTERMVTVPLDISDEDLKQLLIDEKYSRIPVTDGDIDNIVGILPASKALYRLTSGTFLDVSDIMTRPYIIRPDIPVSKVFEGMSGRRTHIAIVSEAGKTLGIVTMEDILEEIAGEIYDEDEQEVSDSAH
ncbi:MAG: HlyC/CorC family transporter [Clostridia bacterium]|nr:HlyC/CorC family transporter [Clostridia bacterium]